MNDSLTVLTKKLVDLVDAHQATESAADALADAVGPVEAMNAWDALETALAAQRQVIHGLVVAKFAQIEGLS